MLLESRVPGARALRLFEARRVREVELECGRSGFGDEALAVEEPDPVAVAFDDERPFQGRRRAQGDLRVPAEELGDPTAGVPAVRRSVRPVEPGLYRQVLHRG